MSIVGARPNFMKVAPLHKEFMKYESTIRHLICHTGQHYDTKMSKVFFDDLELPHPDFYLGVGSGSHAEQTAKIMIEFEKVLLKERPDLIVVVGDVNSTIACSLVAVKLNTPVAHVEAGLRSFDRTMPEEINRILTDRISDYLFVTERSGIENLRKEGVSGDKVFFVGNVMIDSLIHYLPLTAQSDALMRFDVHAGRYVLVTFHRPSNVDSAEGLGGIINLLNAVAAYRPVLFPIHPRTKTNLKAFGLDDAVSKNVKLVDPIGYLDFLALLSNSSLIITDSGGIQEETTYLGIQCITMRENTERPVTIEQGTNHLLGTDLDGALTTAQQILQGENKSGAIPELWDGKASERICTTLVQHLLRVKD